MQKKCYQSNVIEFEEEDISKEVAEEIFMVLYTNKCTDSQSLKALKIVTADFGLVPAKTHRFFNLLWKRPEFIEFESEDISQEVANEIVIVLYQNKCTVSQALKALRIVESFLYSAPTLASLVSHFFSLFTCFIRKFMFRTKSTSERC